MYVKSPGSYSCSSGLSFYIQMVSYPLKHICLFIFFILDGVSCGLEEATEAVDLSPRHLHLRSQGLREILESHSWHKNSTQIALKRLYGSGKLTR